MCVQPQPILQREILTPLTDWFHAASRDLPWRRDRSPWHVWVSEIMLQQTQVNTVIPYYETFMARFPSCQDLAAAHLDDILKLWEGLGYYSRAKNLWRGANYVVNHHDGTVPDTYEELIKIPGIGDYTAGAILSFAFDAPFPAVDGNVVRVIARLTNSPWTQGNAKDKQCARSYVQNLLDHCPDQASLINEGLIELGALICRPKVPECGRCPLHQNCSALIEGTAEELPLPKKSKKRPVEDLTILVVRDNLSGRYPVRRRAPDGLLGGLWEFPYLDGHRSGEEVAVLLEDYGYETLDLRPLQPRRHIFSHLEWNMVGWAVSVKSMSLTDDPSSLIAPIIDGQELADHGIQYDDADYSFLTDPKDMDLIWVDAKELYEKAMATAIAHFRDEAIGNI